MTEEKQKASANYWIEKLQLQKHPEGGYFRETYRSKELYAQENLPKRYKGNRAFATSIYFLLKSNECSKLHKIHSDEVWHYHAGDAVNIHLIDPEGNYSYQKLGPNIEAGEQLQCILPHETWFGATIDNLFGFSLFGCTGAPGFDFQDFELAKRAELLKKFPKHELIIKTLT